MCQFLASEVHKPVLSIPEEEDPLPDSKAPPKKKVVASKPAPQSAAATVLSRPAPTPRQPKLPTPPPPSSVVSQIMEMGFPRRHVEYAIQVGFEDQLDSLEILFPCFLCLGEHLPEV